MNRFKKWLYNRFLPAWCKDDLLETNLRLTETVGEQRREIDRLNAYIDGLHKALRHQPRITIDAKEVRRE